MKRRTFLSAAGASLILPKIGFGKLLSENENKCKLIYQNELSSKEDVKNFHLEGKAIIEFPNRKMKMENALDPSLKQKANFVNWCDVDFPKNISVQWEFKPLREPGLAILFFGAKGVNGESIFSPNLPAREGIYKRYHSGEINTYHISYFRRKHPKERAFHTCNLRKSKGFKLCKLGADPIPSVKDVIDPYKMQVDIFNGKIDFYINDLHIFSFTDDEPLEEGKIGFRQMAPFIAEYSNLKVFELYRN